MPSFWLHPFYFLLRSSLSCLVLQEWSRSAPCKIQMIESWRKVPCLDLGNNHYSTCWWCYAYAIFMHTCSWWVWVPSQQPEPVRLHWLPALRQNLLSEFALPVCMESLKCMRIYVLLPQSLSYAWLVERTNTLASLELELIGQLWNVTVYYFQNFPCFIFQCFYTLAWPPSPPSPTSLVVFPRNSSC